MPTVQDQLVGLFMDTKFVKLVLFFLEPTQRAATNLGHVEVDPREHAQMMSAPFTLKLNPRDWKEDFLGSFGAPDHLYQRLASNAEYYLHNYIQMAWSISLMMYGFSNAIVLIALGIGEGFAMNYVHQQGKITKENVLPWLVAASLRTVYSVWILLGATASGWRPLYVAGGLIGIHAALKRRGAVRTATDKVKTVKRAMQD